MDAPRTASLGFLATLGAGTFFITSGSVPHLAHAQDQEIYLTQVRAQLNAVARIYESRGFARTHDFKLDRLSEGRRDSLVVTLRQGVRYNILGVCDNDCTDLDLKLFDENANLVAEDSSEDDVPIVTVAPRRTAQFRIVINMFKCSDNPCYYGVGVFGN